MAKASKKTQKESGSRKTVLLVIIGIIAILVVWGIIGGIAASDAGVTCDMGLGDAFCWKWHTNALGQVGEFISNLKG